MSRPRGGRRRPMKGFRPGKEPPHLKKQAAKAQLGEDAGKAQKWLVDAMVDHGPDGVKKLVGRWAAILLVLAFVCAAGGALLYRWSLVAGILVHVLAAALLFFWYRLRKQQAAIDQLARSLGLRNPRRKD
jgi:Flp pilus assembly protein TadB